MLGEPPNILNTLYTLLLDTIKRVAFLDSNNCTNIQRISS